MHREQPPEKYAGRCAWCDVVLGLLCAAVALVFPARCEPRSLRHGDRLLFFVFWGVIAAGALLWIVSFA